MKPGQKIKQETAEQQGAWKCVSILVPVQAILWFRYQTVFAGKDL